MINKRNLAIQTHVATGEEVTKDTEILDYLHGHVNSLMS
jgi:hypothetical protein